MQGWICVDPPPLFLHSLQSGSTGNDKLFLLTGSPVPGHLLGVTAMQAEGFCWHQESSGEAIQLHQPEKSFSCSCCLLAGGPFLCGRDVPTGAESSERSQGPQKWLKRPLCCCVCLGTVLQVVKVLWSLFQCRIIPLNHELSFLLIDFGDLPQSGWKPFHSTRVFKALSQKRHHGVVRNKNAHLITEMG